MKKYALLFCFILPLFCCTSYAKNLTLQSTAFEMNTMIPDEYTCKGVDQSPPFTWYRVPQKTQSFVLIVDDPGAPGGVWTHWIVFNIPQDVHQLGAGGPIPPGAVRVKNSWGGLDYRGPCPSIGAHTYHFTLYALDKLLNLEDNASQELVRDAMTDHIIESSELVGLYQSTAPYTKGGGH